MCTRRRDEQGHLALPISSSQCRTSSTSDEDRHAGLESACIVSHVKTQARRVAIVIADRTLGLPGREVAERRTSAGIGSRTSGQSCKLSRLFRQIRLSTHISWERKSRLVGMRIAESPGNIPVCSCIAQGPSPEEVERRRKVVRED
jgi:hypothetical protein